MNNKTHSIRWIAAAYFAIFAVIFNLLTKYFLFVFNAGGLLPVLPSTLLAFILGALGGGLFGRRIAVPNSMSRIFLWGVLLAMMIIPFYSLGLQFIYYFNNHAQYANLHHWQDYVVLYTVLLLFFTLVVGIWFIPATGLAALHFNRRFLPGYIAYWQQQKMPKSSGIS